MYSSSSSNTIYVGNIQSIKDEQLREYFERFGKIEAFYHNCTRAADEWLIDYRFIRFSSDTDMSVFLTNKIDHIICRIRLDIHSYEAAFCDDTRLILDRKICIAHTDSKLDRNVIKKAFARYGRVLNCTCVSSGNGVEYVYIEFDTVNALQSVFSKNQRHSAGRTSLAVKKPFRPSQVGAKIEAIPINENEISRYSSRQRLNSNVDTAQYSSFLANNSIQEEAVRTSNQLSNPFVEKFFCLFENSNPKISILVCQNHVLNDYRIIY
jgi:RNA recognition motif-containing protein